MLNDKVPHPKNRTTHVLTYEVYFDINGTCSVLSTTFTTTTTTTAATAVTAPAGARAIGAPAICYSRCSLLLLLLLLAAYSLRLTTYCLLLTTCDLLLSTCYLQLATYYLLLCSCLLPTYLLLISERYHYNSYDDNDDGEDDG